MVDLDTVEKLVGIAGCTWATPTLKIIYKDGDLKMVSCHDDGPTDPSKRPLWI